MKTSKKWCFVAKEVKGGWRLKLAYGSKDYPVRGIIFKKMEDIEQLTHDGKVVFVHLKNSKYQIEIKEFPGRMVNWFYRTHGHLPDEECSDDNCSLRKK